MAKSGKKVLLIDFDTRYSYLDKMFDTENKNGIGEALTQSLPFESVVNPAANAHFDMISKGKITENLSEYLLGERFQQLLSWANTHYDLVIIDTPPVLSSNDAAIIGQLCWHCDPSRQIWRNDSSRVRSDTPAFCENRRETQWFCTKLHKTDR
ncbi:non-specific protein-tyrosine kinase [Actinobacillus ureae]|uniref:AAA domain-containing protein n=1 Tax=Actinobacillus ureae ATCC 25976 TaxID=887324 RepID=E8KJK7_9PAST|nr:AAA family ATPase [Actinobacillus ureae]EFX90863.1 hypothetical protein HMPREF0027_2024 [Actinobacillus ureae ATCC 25976]SUT87172.1 non-specific protein-tyrosine kinase [Actinobacillus ureae]SUU48110.1 non-specific protein-tyrosine kinase [Actinobacillus ureae]